MTKLDTDQFLASLSDDRLRRAHALAAEVAKESVDTLSDEFQLAAAIESAVDAYVRARIAERDYSVDGYASRRAAETFTWKL